MAAAPAPMSAGVLGMARTTGVPSPSQRSSLAKGTPAAIDSTRWQPASASALQAASTSLGLTAITAPSASPDGSGTTRSPAYADSSSLRLASMGSTTTTSPTWAQPALSSPDSRASPIFPPPRITSFAVIRLKAYGPHPFSRTNAPLRGGKRPR